MKCLSVVIGLAVLPAADAASFAVGAGSAGQPAHIQSGYAGSDQCRDCHPGVYDLWAKSNHGLAERLVQSNVDESAFVPARTISFGSHTVTVEATNGGFYITDAGLSGKAETHRVERVIGNDPLRQFLVAAPGGRWQAMEASYDPHRQEWFNVYGREDRQPGEWGHWTGRGMNWNSMCASCHNTRLEKNYDEPTDSYHTTMAEMTVACEACHGPMQAHVNWQKRYHDPARPDPTLAKLTPVQIMDACASCHARRDDLTGDFKPGDAFFDHFDLMIADHSDAFYADGQVHEEDYEFNAFLGSKMHAAGVTCLDCHTGSWHMPQPHGNEICLRCHATGLLKAPVIRPEEHSHHLAGGKGDECIDCHMPVTTYMQRHPRHDHGFTIPDPWLTKQFGIPNACNRCHEDQNVDWSLAAVEKWYGQKMERPTRQRAEWIARARQGDPAACAPLLSLLANETNSYWQAVAIGLLDQWVGVSEVDEELVKCLAHPDPLVRANAVRALEPLVQAPDSPVAGAIRQLLADPVRNVRISAAWALRAELDTNSPAGRELLHYLDLNADQPAGQLQKGVFYFARRDLPAALEHFQKAVAWDTNSAPSRQEFAVALSAANRNSEAIEQLEIACRLAPQEAEYYYALGLAWHEAGNLPKTIGALESAAKLDPRNDRIWYNLGLARSEAGQIEPALDALSRAETLAPNVARIPYARATILAKTGRIDEARAAAQQALALQPDFLEAAQLLQALPERK